MGKAQFEKRVRWGAIVLMVLLAAEFLRYSYHSFRRAYRFCFGEPERWNTHWLVDKGIEIENSLRISYFSFWAVVIISSMAVFIAALFLLNHFRKGHFFVPETARGIILVGGLLAFAMLIDTIFMAMDPWIITYQNTTDFAPIKYFYDPSDIKAFILSVILMLFGWVMQKAIAIDVENKEFV